MNLRTIRKVEYGDDFSPSTGISISKLTFLFFEVQDKQAYTKITQAYSVRFFTV